MEDSQPPWDPARRSLSFEDAIKGEPELLRVDDSPKNPTKVTSPTPEVEVRVSESKPSKPKVSAATKPDITTTCAEPESAAAATKPKITTTLAEPESAAAGISLETTAPSAEAESVAAAREVATEGMPPSGTRSKQVWAAPSLPAKPPCMNTIPASLCPDDQKHKKQEELVQEDEGAEAEGDDLDGDALTDAPDDEPEGLEEYDDEEGEDTDQDEDEKPEDEKVMRRPAAKAKGKAKAKARGRPKSKASKASPKKKAAKASPKKAPPKGKGRPKASPKKAPVKSKRSKDNDEANSKALKSRKSVAYHKARTEALAAGMTVEEASEIAKEATH